MAGTRPGPRRKYSGEQASEVDTNGGIPEHNLCFGADQRAYTPSDGENDELYGQTAVAATGDQFDKPHSTLGIRHAHRPYVADLGGSTPAQLEAQMPTYRAQRHPRACPRCGLTAACVSLIAHTEVCG